MTKTKQKTLEINLDTIMNPNPKLIQTFKAANAEGMSFELGDGDQFNKSEYSNEKRLFFASKASGTPVKHKLFSLYKKQVGSTSYVYFFDLMTTRDYYKNKVDWTRLCGKWDKPEIITRRAVNPSAMRNDGAMVEPTDFPPEIDGWETQYDFPFEESKGQLEKWWQDGTIPQDAKLYAVTGNNKYGGFNFEEWLNLDCSDLEMIAKFGARVKGLYQSGEQDEKIEALKKLLKEELKNQVSVPKGA